MVENLNNPPKLTPDYERQIERAHKRREDPRLLRTTPPRLVPQLGQQKKQSIPPPEGVFRARADGVVVPPDRGGGS